MRPFSLEGPEELELRGIPTRREPRAGSEAAPEVEPEVGKDVAVSLRGSFAVSHQHWGHSLWGLMSGLGQLQKE